jgi:hypothetical protein
MQGLYCEKCKHFVAPGDYGSQLVASIPLHFGIGDNGRPVAIIAIGRNAVLDIGTNRPLQRMCSGSAALGTVGEIPNGEDEKVAVERGRTTGTRAQRDIFSVR